MINISISRRPISQEYQSEVRFNYFCFEKLINFILYKEQEFFFVHPEPFPNSVHSGIELSDKTFLDFGSARAFIIRKCLSIQIVENEFERNIL